MLRRAEQTEGRRPPFHGHVTYTLGMEGEGGDGGGIGWVRWRDRRNEYGATLIIVQALGAIHE